MCIHISICFNASRIRVHQQPVHLSTFNTRSLSCVHVYMYVHSFIAFNPCMCVCTLYTCQSSTEGLCGFDNNLNISCHNSHRLYWHVCIHMSASASTQLNIFRTQAYVYTHLHQSQIIHGHVRTCQHLCFRPFNWYMSIVNTMPCRQ